MSIRVKQISAMHKVRLETDMDVAAVNTAAVLKGQSYSYQIPLSSREKRVLRVELSSPISEHIRLYAVKNVPMDLAVSEEAKSHPEWDDFITKEAGYMPDLLLPLEEQNNYITVGSQPLSIWVEVKIPEALEAGRYNICISLKGEYFPENEVKCFDECMELEVVDAVLPPQKTVFTQWFHVDCIATAHNVEVYSEKHWQLIDRYMALASSLGINMLLTPVITPSLDIKKGKYRGNTQLVDIEKSGDSYSFDFSKLKRWISLCKKNGIKYLEIAHLFSQWGLKYTPNILVTENGKADYMFGWQVSVRDERYKDFLNQLLPALVRLLEEEGVLDCTCFHISDEPSAEHLEEYKYAHSIVKPLIGNCKIIDAISDYEFYKEGLIDVPVPISSSVDSFIGNKAQNLFTYYCCISEAKESNRFMSMPSYRNRIIGLQLYKYGLKGFLHWGYNFYNSRLSRYTINPYLTTSADLGFPSGDSFSVYPYRDTALPSLRAMVFRDALEDIRLCSLLESYIGKEGVVKLIDGTAGMEITFSDYPRNSEYIPTVMKKIIDEIRRF